MDIDVPEGKPFGQQYRYRYIHVEAKFAVLRDVPLGGNNIGEMQTGGFPPDGDFTQSDATRKGWEVYFNH